MCKPFYLPKECSLIILTAVYIQPSASTPSATQQLANHISEVEKLDAVPLALGNFSHIFLRKALPSYKPQIHIATRHDKTLDQCYSTIPEAYHAVSRAPLGESDHNSIFLILQYHQKLKATKPNVKRFRRWTPQAIDELKYYFDTTDWRFFLD